MAGFICFMVPYLLWRIVLLVVIVLLEMAAVLLKIRTGKLV